MNNLKEWLNINDNLKMINGNNNNRYIITKENIMKNDIIMKIHLSKMIYTPLENSYISPSSILAMKTMYMSKEPYYKPYFNILPKNITNLMNYNLSTLQIIKNSQLKKRIDEYNKIIRDDMYLLNSFIKNKKVFYYYRLLVSSRSFNFTMGKNKFKGMIPYADMLNHSLKPNSYWYYNEQTKYFEVRAKRDIFKDEEITYTYGNKNNLELFLYYGFTIKDNPNKIIKIKNTVLPDINEMIKKKIDKNIIRIIREEK
jgi:hypothetical protein